MTDQLPPKADPAQRLAISLLSPAGDVVGRWGADERAVADIPRGLGFGTSDPGGFKDSALALSRPINREWPDLKLLRDIRISGPGKRTAWEGRLQETPSHHGDDFAISPAAVGHAAELEGDPTLRECYVGRDLSEWSEISAQWRIAWATSFANAGFSVAVDTGEGRQALSLDVEGSWTTQIPIAAAMLDPGAGVKIAAVDYEAFLNTADAAFVLELLSADDDKPTGNVSNGDIATGATTIANTITPATPKRVIAWQWRYSVAGGAAGAQFRALIRNLAWFGNHGLPIRGARPTRGLFASDVIADIVGRTAPALNYSTGDEGSIVPSTYAIPHLVFRDPVKGADAILAVNAYHQRSWGVEENKTFFWRPTTTYRKRWKIRRSRGHGVDLLGPQADDAINGVVVSFTDPAGVTRVVAPIGVSSADLTSEALQDTRATNPVNAAGIARKYAELRLSFATDLPGALQVGAAYLAEKIANTKARGAVTVTGLVEDLDTSTLYPSWCMRAGDSATVVDGDKVERRIIETSYDYDSRTCSAQLDATPHKVEALMERMGISLVGVTG